MCWVRQRRFAAVFAPDRSAGAVRSEVTSLRVAVSARRSGAFLFCGEISASRVGNLGTASATMRTMKAKQPFLVSLAAVALCAGCASTGPSTERGAVTGAAIGAVGGAILGNNVGGGGHHPLLGAAVGATAGAVAGGAYGNRKDREQGTARDVLPPANASTQYGSYGGYVQTPPPTPTSEPADNYTPQPSGNAVWVRGHYEYSGDGRSYQWVPGHWETPPAGARSYVAGHWEQQAQGYVWVPGSWR